MAGIGEGFIQWSKGEEGWQDPILIPSHPGGGGDLEYF